MGGIAGIINFDGTPVTRDLIEGMAGAMQYRGPDGIRFWNREAVALSHCSIHTTQESKGETQPLLNEGESLVLVMDGWLSNWEELRQRLLLKQARLRDRSDAELVLRAYEYFGEDCLQFLEGDFAIVIWDSRRGEVFCARDRMGHKPFHYHWNGKTLAFASDLKPVLELPWVGEEPNEAMVAEYLSVDWYSRMRLSGKAFIVLLRHTR